MINLLPHRQRQRASTASLALSIGLHLFAVFILLLITITTFTPRTEIDTPFVLSSAGGRQGDSQPIQGLAHSHTIKVQSQRIVSKRQDAALHIPSVDAPKLPTEPTLQLPLNAGHMVQPHRFAPLPTTIASTSASAHSSAGNGKGPGAVNGPGNGNGTGAGKGTGNAQGPSSGRGVVGQYVPATYFPSPRAKKVTFFGHSIEVDSSQVLIVTFNKRDIVGQFNYSALENRLYYIFPNAKRVSLQWANFSAEVSPNKGDSLNAVINHAKRYKPSIIIIVCIAPFYLRSTW